MDNISSTTKNTFWTNDPSILYLNDNYLIFFPKYDMTRVEQLNAMTRFCIYALILILIFYGNTKWLFIPLIGLIMIIVLYNIYNNDPKGKEKELYRQKGEKFYSETNNNLGSKYELESGYYDSDNKLHLGKEYTEKSLSNNKKINYDMNEMLEYQKAICRKPTSENPFMNPPITDFNDGDKPVACNADDEDIKEKINTAFNTDLYRDIQDLFDTHNSQRQFYTIVEAIPNDQPGFANWLYGSTSNCKVNQQQCLEYEDLRYKR